MVYMSLCLSYLKMYVYFHEILHLETPNSLQIHFDDHPHWLQVQFEIPPLASDVSKYQHDRKIFLQIERLLDLIRVQNEAIIARTDITTSKENGFPSNWIPFLARLLPWNNWPFSILTQASQPNGWRWSTFGRLPILASYGVIPLSALESHQFKT